MESHRITYQRSFDEVKHILRTNGPSLVDVGFEQSLDSI